MSLRLVRSLHTLPRLTPSQRGPLSAEAFQLAWTQHQQHLTNELNVLTAGTADETRNPLAIVLMSQRDSKRQRVHNVASQLFNNHFFFLQFNGEQPKIDKHQPSRILLERITQRFGSLEGLKQEFLTKEDDLVGQGWLFLVEQADKSLEVISLNNSGTPFTGVKLDMDLNGPINNDQYLELVKRAAEVQSDSNNNTTLPLLAINLWDHVYLKDYGVAGRKKYLEEVWDALDWEVVNKRVFSF